MHLTRYHDVNEFYARAEAFLVAHEAEHCLILGLCNVLRHRPERYPEFYLALVEDDGSIVAAALRTLPHNLTLSLIDLALINEAVDLLVRDIVAVYPDLPGVGAASDVGAAFVAHWKLRTGQDYIRQIAERIFKVARVNPPMGILGKFRIFHHLR